MHPKINAAVALATMAVAGCTPTRSELRRDAILPALHLEPVAQGKGRIIAPKRCELTLYTLARPLNDPAVNESLWAVADEQALAPEVRRVLEANGLRVGLIAGNLPREVEEVLHAPPPHQVEPSHIQIYNGENTLYSLCPPSVRATLMLNRGERVEGRDYTDVSGFLRLTTTHAGPAGISVRVVPELHHGPVRQGFTADANSSPFTTPQFVVHEGQQEDMLRELAATLTLEAGQVIVVGCRPDRERSLGHYLFTAPEANSDRLIQKALLIRGKQVAGDAQVAFSGTMVEPPPAPSPAPGLESTTP